MNATAALVLGPEVIEALATRAAQLVLAELAEAREPDRWMNARQGAVYLGMTLNALHKLTAARAIPFAQDAPRGKCWFLRSELDEWRRRGR